MRSAQSGMSFGSINLSAGSITSPVGRGRREAPGEGLRSLVRAAAPHPICCANRPLPKGGEVNRVRGQDRLNQYSSALERKCADRTLNPSQVPARQIFSSTKLLGRTGLKSRPPVLQDFLYFFIAS